MGVTVINKTVCVTGTVPGLSRREAEQKLRDAGAHTVSSVTKNTHLLITGGGVGEVKVAKAEKLGVVVIPWQDVALDGVGDEAPVSAAAPPPKVLAARQVAPMLAVGGTLSETDDTWVYEIKWDGVRAVATIQDGAVAIQSRSAKTDLAKRFPDVASTLTDFPDCVLDGEMVVLTEDEIGGSFNKIARHSTSGSATFIVFDVIECQGQDLRQMHFGQRRELLEAIVSEDTNRIAKSPIWEDGDTLMAHVVDNGLEGIVAKPLNSTYREGHRGPWMKIKVRLSQEFVVVGYKPGTGHIADTMGALLLAVNDEHGQLVMCGAVGTGFEKPERYEIQRKLDAIADIGTEQDVAMTDKERRELARENAVWVEPQYVVQVEFQRWTNDDRLWHPSFQGFRDDKEPADVVREA